MPSFYFLQNYIQEITTLYYDVDIVFSNFAEARYFGDLLGISSKLDIKDLIIQLASLTKNNMNKNRIVVITNGPNPAWVCEYSFLDGNVKSVFSCPVRPLDHSLIIDTNGAGDSFAGGFLSQYMRGRPIDECMICGHWASSMIIQVRGCQIPYGLEYIPEDARKDILGDEEIDFNKDEAYEDLEDFGDL